MKRLKKISIIIGYTIAGILLLLCLLLLLLQTPAAKRKIADIVTGQVNANINGQLHIGKMEGNFLSGISLSDVVLTYKNDTVAAFPRLELLYRLWPLLSGRIVVEKVVLDKPYLYLEQYQDSTWNVQHLAKPSEKPEKETPSAFTMTVDLWQLTLMAGCLKINSLDSVIPRRVERLNIDLSGNYSRDTQVLDVRTFTFITRQPGLELKNLRLRFVRNRFLMEVKDLLLQTAYNRLKADVVYDMQNGRPSVAKVETDPIRLSEFSSYLPRYLRTALHPVVQLFAEQAGDKTTVKLDIAVGQQSANLELHALHLLDNTQQSRIEPVRYQVQCALNKLNVQDWVNRPGMNYKVTGRLSAKGSGIQPSSMHASLDGAFSNLVVQGKNISRLDTRIVYSAGNANVQLSGRGDFGQVRLQAALQDVLGTYPRYQAKLDASALNLEALLKDTVYRSNLNLNLKVTGAGFAPGTMQAHLAADASPSSMAGFSIGQLSSDLRFAHHNITVNHLDAKTSTVELHARGNYNLSGPSDLTLEALLYNVSEIEAFTGMKDLQTQGRLQAKVSGIPADLSGTLHLELGGSRYQDFHFKGALADVTTRIQGKTIEAEGNVTVSRFTAGTTAQDSIRMQGHNTGWQDIRLHAQVSGTTDDMTGAVQMEMDSNRYHDFRFKSLLADVVAHVRGKAVQADGSVAVNQFANGNMLVDSIRLQASSDMKRHDICLQANGKEINMGLMSSVETGESTRIGLQNLDLDYKGYAWKLTRPALVQFGVADYRVDSLELVSQRGDTVQRLYADGWIRKNGLQDLRLEVESVDIPRILKLFGMQQNIQGRFSLNSRVEGPADAPLISADMKVQNGQLEQYKLDTLTGHVRYAGKMLEASIQLVVQDSSRLSVEGHIPSGIRFDTMSFDLKPQDDDLVSGRLFLQKLPLAMFKNLTPLDVLNGFAQSDITIGGTMKHPVPAGNFQIRNAAMEMRKYGVEYKDIQTGILLNDKVIKVDTFIVRSWDGYMAADGRVTFNSEVYNADLNTSDLKVRFNKFNPVNNPQFNLQVSGETGLTGNKQGVSFSGDLEIPKSYFYIPAILRLTGQSTPSETSLPLLAEAMQRQRTDTMGIAVPQHRDSVVTAPRFTYFDNLQGKIKVSIPHNTWIKNDQMRMELSGDIDLVKHEHFFELFGTVDVVRGQYEMLGKTFIVKSGQVTFQGGEKMNPQLALEAQYTFRDQEKNSRVLAITVSGNMTSPEIKFSLDDEAVSEGDALSYILFGTSMSTLGSSQQEAMGSSGFNITDMAQSSAASLISSQLTQVLGKTIPVDYLELKTGGTFDNVSLVMGKYITNNLFVSYEQNVGNFNKDLQQAYEVRMEYQLFKFLFVQLVSSPLRNGLDFMFKVDARK